MEHTHKACVALGNFNGLHIGHKAVLKVAAAQKSAGLRPCALLFQEHPRAFFTGTAPKSLLSEEARDVLLKQMGITPVCIPFARVQALKPRAFVEGVLQEKLQAQAVSCGYNYRFGQGGKGDVRLLQTLCDERGINLYVAPPVEYEGEPVSSTRIRTCLERGEIEQVNAMLGRCFSYAFPVVEGDRRGRVLGWPTINQVFPGGMAVPRFGVYASRVLVEGKWYQGVTNIGMRPTFQGEDLRSETHILGYSGNLYEKKVPVELCCFLRPERQFVCFEALKEQIAQDAQRAIQFHLQAPRT